MKSAGYVLLACIPPTLAAARITYWGFSAAKKESTSDWRVRSSSEWERRTRLVKPWDWSLRTIAEPTRPRCPATKIFADLSVRKSEESAEKC
jgi:hypothetical protein